MMSAGGSYSVSSRECYVVSEAVLTVFHFELRAIPKSLISTAKFDIVLI